jgi:hypothetical protein
MGAGVIRLKLDESLAEATKLAAKEPHRYQVGANGWVAAKWSGDQALPLDVMTRWIDESYRLMAPKQTEALPPRGKAKRKSTKPAKRKAR